jgi:uncharacterized protein (TIGR02996 family)
VSEDEAFIRAVVDRPGDDTARLVYADWLDERSDPRGAYLRAEFEWAKPWRGGERPAESAELLAMAATLDPVWVARVSRPPVGVCCDHVRFENRAPELRATTLDEAETQLAVRFPYRLRALLLNYNGGEPSPSGFVPGWLTDAGGPDDFPAVGSFARVNPGAPLDLVEATRSCRRIGMPNHWVFLALVPEASVLVVEVARGSGRGRVFYWDNAATEYDGDAVSFQATSIADFLATIADPQLGRRSSPRS